MSDIDFYRSEIDSLDGKIMNCLEKRFVCTKEIGKIKKKKGISIIDKEREDEIIQKRKSETDLPDDFVERLYRLIFEESYKNQRQ